MAPWLPLLILGPIALASFGLFAEPRHRAALLALAIVVVPLSVLLFVNLAELPELFTSDATPRLSSGVLADQAVKMALGGALPALLAWGIIWRAPAPCVCPRMPLRPLAKARRGAALTLGLVALLGLGLGLVGPFQATAQTTQGLWSEVTPWLLVGLSLVAAVTEELMFRGVLYVALVPLVGFVVGGLVQGVLFGLVHAAYGDPLYVAAAVIFGVVQAYVSVRWGLLVAIMVHAQVNLLILGWASRGAFELNAMLALAVLGFNLVLLVPAAVACLTSSQAQCPIQPGEDGLPARTRL